MSLIDAVDVHDDHLEVTVRGAPKRNVTLAEVGLGRLGGDWSCRRGDTNPKYTRSMGSRAVYQELAGGGQALPPAPSLLGACGGGFRAGKAGPDAAACSRDERDEYQ